MSTSKAQPHTLIISFHEGWVPVVLAAPLLAGLADLVAGFAALGATALGVLLGLVASVAAIDNTDLRIASLMVTECGRRD